MKKLSYTLYVIIEDKPFLSLKEISYLLKVDKALIHKSLKELMNMEYIVRTIDKPYKYIISNKLLKNEEIK